MWSKVLHDIWPGSEIRRLISLCLSMVKLTRSYSLNSGYPSPDRLATYASAKKSIAALDDDVLVPQSRQAISTCQRRASSETRVPSRTLRSLLCEIKRRKSMNQQVLFEYEDLKDLVHFLGASLSAEGVDPKTTLMLKQLIIEI